MSIGDQNGLFTEAQREYLIGEKQDISKEYENSLRSKIRNRINSVFIDLMLLRNLDEKERRLTFESNVETTPKGDVVKLPEAEEFVAEGNIGLWNAFIEFTKFYHRVRRENGASTENVCNDIAYALETAEQEHLNNQYEVSATVKIKTIQEVDIQEALDRFENDGLDGVSSVELKALAEAGEIALHGYENE